MSKTLCDVCQAEKSLQKQVIYTHLYLKPARLELKNGKVSELDTFLAEKSCAEWKKSTKKRVQMRVQGVQNDLQLVHLHDGKLR